jgi:hypothetical protein
MEVRPYNGRLHPPSVASPFAADGKAGSPQQALGVIPRPARLGDEYSDLAYHARQKQRALHLSARHRHVVFERVELTSLHPDRKAPWISKIGESSSHRAEWTRYPPHRPRLE